MIPCSSNHRVLYKLWLVLILAISFCVTANTESDSRNILTLIEQHNATQAYKLAMQLQEKYEGEPDFDFAFGIAAQASGHYHQAIFALERVVKANSGWLQARYALAVSYFAAGNLSAAELEFNNVKSQDSQNAFPKITQFLQQIAEKTSRQHSLWRHQAELAIGGDSNGNSGADVSSIFIPQIGEINLFDSSQATRDGFVQLSWQSKYLNPINQRSKVFAIGKLRHGQYINHSELSRTFADLFVGWQGSIDDYDSKFSAFYRPLWLDNNQYLNFYGVMADISSSLNQNQQLGGQVLWGKQDYQQNAQDKTQWFLAPYFSLSLGQLQHRVSVNYGQDTSSQSEFAYLGRDFWGASYQVSFAISSSQLLSAHVNYSQTRHHQIHPLFQRRRNDFLWRAGVNYQQSIDHHWHWLMQLTYLKNDSDLLLYDYDRALITSSIQYQF